MQVYIYRKALDCPYEWAEVDPTFFVPVHPGELLERVRNLIAEGKKFATYSDIVLSMLGWMVRKGELKLPILVIYVEADGKERTNYIDDKGDLIYPIPEDGFESIQEAGFHYRYD